MKIQKKLAELNACKEALEWLGEQDPRTAWEKCERGDWMLWAVGCLGLDRRLLVLAACDCADQVSHLMPFTGLLALHITREWCEGREDLETVRAAADAAYADASASSAASAASAAANAAADAADATADDAADAAAAAYAAATDAAAAAYAADAAADAAYASAVASLKHSADLVRTRISWAVVEKLL
jgi:hypothetical protein